MRGVQCRSDEIETPEEASAVGLVAVQLEGTGGEQVLRKIYVPFVDFQNKEDDAQGNGAGTALDQAARLIKPDKAEAGGVDETAGDQHDQVGGADPEDSLAAAGGEARPLP